MRSLFTFTSVLIFTFSYSQKNDKNWVAPDSANQIKNPYSGDQSMMGSAAKLYLEHCQLCHGAKGNGKGVAKSNDIVPSDLTTRKVQNQSDGVLFWKMSNGHNRMLAYKAILTEKQRWSLVNYIRRWKKR